MNIKKALIAAVAGSGAVALAAAAALPAAQADPSGPPTYRALAGVGSDTTQDLMNALADIIEDGGVKIMASYNATGSADITTKDPAVNPDCTFARPNGSSAGRQALADSLIAGNDCIQFARSSSSPKDFGAPLTHIPAALDAVSFAVNSDGDVSTELSLAELTAIYKCEVPSIVPVLPQTGSGTRGFWLKTVGVTDEEIESGTYPCLLPVADGGTGVPYTQEHDGRELKNNEVAPYSIAVYQAQATKQRVDVRGKAVLGVIDGVAPTVINSNFPVTRLVYNVIPTSKVTEPNSLEYKTFVGSDSYVCANVDAVNLQGFGVTDECGDTSRTSN